MGDFIFYLLDVFIFIMLLRWQMNSRKVKVETKIGAKWIIPLLFVAVAVIGFFRYKDTPVFRWVQTISLLVFAGMYYMLRSGLADEGVVMMGSLTKWDNAGDVTLNRKESCLLFKLRKRTAALYFDPDQLEDVRKFLADHSVKNTKR